MGCPLPPRVDAGSPANLSAVSAKELAAIACAVARLTAVLCDVLQPGATAPGMVAEDEPYIWDLIDEEPHANNS